MYNVYARVFNDESDEDEAAAGRLLRETAGGRPPPVASNVLTSTSAARGRTQQAILQRRGGTRADNAAGTTIVTPPTQPAAGSAGMGNLIDFGDAEPEPRGRASAAAPTARAEKGKQRSRGQLSTPPQVELVTLAPSDPFDFFLQHGGAQPQASTSGQPDASQQPAQSHRTAQGEQQPQHPLDLLFGPEPSDPGKGPSSGAALPGPGPGPRSQPAAAFPSFGSFSDLLLPLAGTFGAGVVAPAAVGPPPAAGTSGSGSSAAWGSFNGAGAAPASGAGAGAGTGSGAGESRLQSHGQPGGTGSHPMQRNPVHSQSSNGIDDLLLEQRARREAEDAATAIGAGGGSAAPTSGAGGMYKAPGVVRTDRGEASATDVFDPFGAPVMPVRSASASGRGFAAPGGGGGGSGAASGSGAAEGDGGGGNVSGSGRVSGSGGSFAIGSGGGEGFNMNQRELLLYAIPLFKDRLVFLPVVNWQERADTSTVLGKVSAGVSSVQQNISHMWHSLKDKGEFSAKIYKAGQAILENMNAEERLMRNIPRKANKLVVHHPAAIPPDEVQDQLTQLTSSFCYKSAGKAAVAGVMLPVAVGLEVIAVPGIGWYTAYQLFKSTSAAAGGSRLNNYLKSDKSEVRVCYAPSTKMDIYLLKSRLNPDGVLGSEDIEDLCHDIREPALLHPLTELRHRQLKKTQTTKADYALLPMSAPDVDEQYGGGPKKKD